ncbi:MAG: parvulin peptidyl-prolyl isomerase [Candidatus Cloacimonadota bacterium]|nr:MAG: parvulin peptidyl-prolyl isomerase [Candidatus Cloacimonadota bacterium]RLC57896.1 MAG: parvulin peptidyl-prolyl isomerase [Candidatus Cloacimonadota bacterium]
MKVAIVNDYEISIKEYKAELREVLAKMKLETPNQEAKNRALDQLIDGYLLLCKAKSSDIEITQDEIDNEFIELLLEYDSKEDFDKMMAQNGLDYDKVKDKIRNELLIKKYINCNFPPSTDIPLEKLNHIYLENNEVFKTQEMIKASHILIRGDSAESLKKIRELRETINTADDFIAEVTNCSECPSCTICGDLGYITRGKMVKEFEDVAFNLKINEISQPVKTQFGYHLIMVTDRKKSEIAKFEDVKDALQKRLQQIECELNLIKHIKELRSNAEIFIKHDAL